MKKLAMPGDVLLSRPLRLEHTIVENGKTYATVLGIFDEERASFIPLESLWYPCENETAIGIIEESKLNVYTVNLNAPYKGIIISKYTRDSMSNGDIIEASVKELDKTGTVVLSRPRVLHGGKVLYVKPSKIPRIIGSNNTMIRQICKGTNSNISIGMNGMIWMSGGNTDLATEAISRIVKEAHISGLTNRISEMLGTPKPDAQETSTQVHREA